MPKFLRKVDEDEIDYLSEQSIAFIVKKRNGLQIVPKCPRSSTTTTNKNSANSPERLRGGILSHWYPCSNCDVNHSESLLQHLYIFQIASPLVLSLRKSLYSILYSIYTPQVPSISVRMPISINRNGLEGDEDQQYQRLALALTCQIIVSNPCYTTPQKKNTIRPV
jgi:hypothetical protein